MADTKVKDTQVKESNFFKHVLIASLISFIIASYPVYAYAASVQIYSIICGFGIALINAIAGYMLNRMAFNKPVKVFMAVVFGGMGLRILFICLLLLILLYFAKLDEVSLIASVFYFYIVFSAIEIYHLHTRTEKAKQQAGKTV